MFTKHADIIIPWKIANEWNLFFKISMKSKTKDNFDYGIWIMGAAGGDLLYKS